jgi:large subunit ribosomal protein L29
MEIATSRSFSDEQLVHAELSLERDLISATFQHRTGQLDDSTLLGKLRKDIARLRTLQRQREIDAGSPRDSLRNTHRGTFDAESAISAQGSAEGASKGFLAGIVDKISSTD